MMNWINKLFGQKNKAVPTCSNCMFYNRTDVIDNRSNVFKFGSCSSINVQKDAVPYGRSAQGFYKWEWPVVTGFSPISFAPDFSCKHHKERTKIKVR